MSQTLFIGANPSLTEELHQFVAQPVIDSLSRADGRTFRFAHILEQIDA